MKKKSQILGNGESLSNYPKRATLMFVRTGEALIFCQYQEKSSAESYYKE
jgi:hypothetical protein